MDELEVLRERVSNLLDWAMDKKEPTDIIEGYKIGLDHVLCEIDKIRYDR